MIISILPPGVLERGEMYKTFCLSMSKGDDRGPLSDRLMMMTMMMNLMMMMTMMNFISAKPFFVIIISVKIILEKFQVHILFPMNKLSIFDVHFLTLLLIIFGQSIFGTLSNRFIGTSSSSLSLSMLSSTS